MTRKEAIKKVRWGLLGLAIDKDVRDAFETLIPELKESEDEKIRKWLYDYIERVGKTWGKPGPFDYTQILAYLEKQKECVADNKTSTDEDEKIIQNLIDIFTEYKKSGGVDFRGIEIDTLLAWLEKQKGKMTAEEFEKSELFQLKLKTKYDNGYQDGLAQKEQKPVEWSEEDKNVIETLIRELRLNAQFEFAVRKLGLDYIQTLAVLDKCRRLCPCPSWKPSEQEKGALRTAIYVLTEERSFPKAAAQLQNILDAFE